MTDPDVAFTSTTYTIGSQTLFAQNPTATLSSLTNSVRRSTRTLRNRLHSIKEDSNFVLAVARAYDLPLVTNARAGDWYVDPKIKAAGVYFKSTDGHTNEWGFSRRRLNLNLLELVGRGGGRGAVVVDSTRRGKRFPDALSKTIPIWIAVLNKALFPSFSSSEFTLYTTPLAVFPSEHSQIEQRLPQFYQDFLSLDLDLSSLRKNIQKPLRPLFITPDSPLPAEPPVFTDFVPLVLVTASRMMHGMGMEGEYIQGAGDDHEGWASSTGLTPSFFWTHHKELLAIQTEEELEERVAALVSHSGPETTGAVGGETATLINPTKNIFISSTALALSSTTTEAFDTIINCSEDDTPANKTSGKASKIPQIIGFPISAKKQGNKTLRLGAPALLAQLEPVLRDGKRVVFCDKTGDEVAPAVVLLILCAFYNGEGNFEKQDLATIDKSLVKRRLAWISASRSSANPPRTLLNGVNSVLMERR